MQESTTPARSLDVVLPFVLFRVAERSVVPCVQELAQAMAASMTPSAASGSTNEVHPSRVFHLWLTCFQFVQDFGLELALSRSMAGGAAAAAASPRRGRSRSPARRYRRSVSRSPLGRARSESPDRARSPARSRSASPIIRGSRTIRRRPRLASPSAERGAAPAAAAASADSDAELRLGACLLPSLHCCWPAHVVADLQMTTRTMSWSLSPSPGRLCAPTRTQVCLVAVW